MISPGRADTLSRNAQTTGEPANSAITWVSEPVGSMRGTGAGNPSALSTKWSGRTPYTTGLPSEAPRPDGSGPAGNGAGGNGLAGNGPGGNGKVVPSSDLKAPPSILPLRKFIAGEPMNPATKRFK